MAMPCRIKSHTVVTDGKLQAAVIPPDRNFHRVGTGMAGDISQSLLRHTKEAQGRAPRHRPWQVFQLHCGRYGFAT